LKQHICLEFRVESQPRRNIKPLKLFPGERDDIDIAVLYAVSAGERVQNRSQRLKLLCRGQVGLADQVLHDVAVGTSAMPDCEWLGVNILTDCGEPVAQGVRCVSREYTSYDADPK
jgi:hypothetical protein